MPKFRYSLDTGLSHIYLDVPLPYTIASGPGQTVIVEPMGPTQTLAGFDANRVPEISQMTGARTAVVPQTYFDAQTADAFNTDNHSVGDPLVPTCAIYTHKAIRSGNWSDPTMWDVGTTPHAATDGTAVVCSGEFDIVYDVLSDVKIKDIHINGRGSLSFATTTRTRLWVDTIMCDGKLVMGQHGAPIPDSGVVTSGKRQPQCEVVFWQSQAPLKTSRLGLNTMGPVRIQGAAKTNRLFSTETIAAGATTITLDQSAGTAGWKIGDEILICSSEWAGTASSDPQYTGPMTYWDYNGSHTANQYMLNFDEVRTITAIAGNTITLNSALTFTHGRYTRTLPRGEVVDILPVVAMLTHSIRFRTADSSDTAIWAGADLSVRQKRAHMMFMLHDDIQIRYAESKNMGRTDTDPSLADPNPLVIRYATSGTSTPITDVNNVRGRYPWHVHRTGAFFGRKQVVLQGVSAWAPPAEVPIPGWAITHHDSRAAVEDCVVFNVRGAGIVSELGNETGQWMNNTVAWARGDGHFFFWGERAEGWTNHNGHMGAAYENQARQILQQGNIATSSRTGWTYMQQDQGMLARIPHGDSLRYRDPLTQGGRANVPGDYTLDNDTYGIEQAQVPDFFDNHAYGCLNAFWRAHVVNIDRHDKTPFILKHFHAINCPTVYNLINYTYVYYFYDCLWIGNSQVSAVGAKLGPVSWEHGFVNMRLERMSVGFLDQGHGLGYQSYWIDVEFGAGAWGVTTPFSQVDVDFGVDPTTHSTYGVMGPWTVTGATTAKTRTWANITAANLPVPYPLAPYGPDSTFRSANPCPAVGQSPYVIVDPTSDLTWSPTGNFGINIKAYVVDSVGYRRFGDYQSPETAHSIMSPKLSVSPEWATGTTIALRNGVFNDAGTWKTRLWFNDIDRYTGDHFTYAIDVTLTGFDTGFLAANTVDPMATKPATPLLPEALSTSAMGTSATPVVVTASAQVNIEAQPLAIALKANTGLVRWAITGGADAADFEVVYSGNQWVLRWASNGVKDYEAPDDTGVNNVYDVTVTCTSFAGLTASQNIAVTVTDLIESVTSFSDDFASPVGQFLDARPGYLHISGPTNRLSIGTGGTVQNEAASGTTTYMLPDITIVDDFVMRAKFPVSGGPAFRLAGPSNAFAGQRLLMRKDNDTSQLWVIYVNIAGTVTTWPYGNPNSDLVTLEVIDNAFRLLFNGVAQTSSNGAAQVIEPMPAGHRFYLTADLTSLRPNVLDDLYIGPA